MPKSARAASAPDLAQASWYFEAPAPLLAPLARDSGATRRRGFSGVAYSGAAVSEGWGTPIAIDLATVRLPENCPVLLSHEHDKRVGVCRLAVAEWALACDGYLLANDAARELAADADDGFPWQLSVHAQPGSIEEIKAGTQAQVNGQTFTGPLLIFRHTSIRELSFTPTGVDSNTHARIWSASPHAISPPNEALTMSQLDDAPAQLAQLAAENATLREDVAQAIARAETAETALAAQQRAVRLAAVQSTFAQLGRQVTDADAEVYLALEDSAWTRVAQDLLAAKPPASAHLFEEQASGNPGTGAEDINLSAIYQARREVIQ